MEVIMFVLLSIMLSRVMFTIVPVKNSSPGKHTTKWIIHTDLCMYSRGELFMRSGEVYFADYFPSSAATREKNNPRMSV